MKKLLRKIIDVRESVSFVFVGPVIIEELILFGKFTIVKTYKIREDEKI